LNVSQRLAKSVVVRKARKVNQMEEQIAPSANAHLLRRALVLGSLVAACTTTFALAAGVSRSELNTEPLETTIMDTTPTLAPTVTPCAVRAYISNSNSNNVSVIDTANNTVTATVVVGQDPFGVTVNPQALSRTLLTAAAILVMFQ
jgi:YVTN family beta-propeller protein